MATPGSGIIRISDLSSQLGGENNLGYYRGRTYYRSGSPVVISQNPSLSEFYNLSNVAPLNSLRMYQFACASAGDNGFIQIVYYPNSMNVGVHAFSNANLTYGPAAMNGFNPALYHGFNFSYILEAGFGLSGFSVAEGQGGGSDGRNILQWNFNGGASFNVIAVVSATPN